ncbi:p21-activated protein kinase-interacting protein 1-like [Gigantopelta aegis]|uniref:p21-activated protein kinase-interacting protein 1-like n=1 Tax=Gigantopelta aegis TaxID=1735272 RepID=UPI001B88E19D|nr:p21-activated protein kinase-interacting protein 1-like [Gigantopelta aegis]
MEVVAGTYEELLLGYRLVKSDTDGVYHLEASFTDHSHIGCVKTVAISQKGILASGSTDETIRLFNLRKRKEMGSLVQHMGSVMCLEFFKGTHLFSCAEDGNLCVWKSFTWECLKILKGHKGGINCLSVHPSGKMALTVGKDKTLHTWNLMTGRSAYVSNIKQVADIVKWSPDGNHYIVVCNNTIDVYKVETCSVQVTITAPRRINSAVFLDPRCLVYGGEGGVLYVCDINTGSELYHEETGTNRIRGIAVTESYDGNKSHWVTTASSDGVINVYQLKLSKTVKSKLLAKFDTKFRLTSVAVTPYAPPSDKPLEPPTGEVKEEELVIPADGDSHSDTSDSEPEQSKTVRKGETNSKRKRKSPDVEKSKPVSKKQKKTSKSEEADSEKTTGKKKLKNKKRRKKEADLVSTRAGVTTEKLADTAEWVEVLNIKQKTWADAGFF